MKQIAGHTFLSKLGKKRLRPGGIKATKWLMARAHIKTGDHLLEVACNMGTTLIDISKKHDITAIGIDIDDEALNKARQYADKLDLSSKLTFTQANATALPFEDSQFDIIINEAMLTMLNDQQKKAALHEYYRVLKKGGILLTHDVYLRKNDPTLNKRIKSELSHTILVPVQPLTKEEWLNLIEQAKFQQTDVVTGPMSLMKPIGMIRDEGLFNTINIMTNALKKQHRSRFKSLYHMFKTHDKHIGFIATANTK